MNRRTFLLASAAAASCAQAQPPAPAHFPMRCGVNLGNALEAPSEGEWGYRIEPAHLVAIADAGFDGIRLPVRWDARTARTPPYAIDTPLLLRIASIIDPGLALGLRIQLDCHHYDALIENPEAERERFLAIWRQIAFDQQDAPPNLSFEPLNEPHGSRWTGDFLRALQTEVLAVIRETNPRRLVVFGGPNWNSLDGLRGWRPPEDENVAATFHYYEPHAFTHWRAEWLPPSTAPNPGFTEAPIRAHMREAAAWSRAHGAALQLGEFGANRALPLAERAAYTRAVREAAEAEGLVWCAWDFAGAFPIWNRERGAFIPEMLASLLD